MFTEEEKSDADFSEDGPSISSAEEGVRKFTLRVNILEERIARCREWLAKGVDPEGMEAEEVRLIGEVRQVRQRLAEYQAQLDGRN